MLTADSPRVPRDTGDRVPGDTDLSCPISVSVGEWSGLKIVQAETERRAGVAKYGGVGARSVEWGL